MRPRVTALVLGLLLLAVSVFAAASACCDAGRPALTAMRSIDCCGAGLRRCPPTIEAIFTAELPTAGPTPQEKTASATAGTSDAVPDVHDRPTPSPSLTPLLSRPPLFRLHSQLLI